MQDGVYSKFGIPENMILLKIEQDKTPESIVNFVALAEGNLKDTIKLLELTNLY